MYNASTGFHEAVANGEPQKALLIFNDAVFDGNDIDIDTGIEFDDNFNLKEDICIGQALSNEIRFALFNDDRLLNDYEFGEFTATIGVRVDTDTYRMEGNATVQTGYAKWVGRVATPYLRRNGVTIAMQHPFPVAALLAYNGKVYAFSEEGQYAVFNDATGTEITDSSPVNAFMRTKGKAWYGKGMRYIPANRELQIWENGTLEIYEFVPLGVFEGERPNAPNQIRIEMTCYDRMSLFEKDMSEVSVSYPTTIGGLMAAICNHVGVPYRTTSFINSDVAIASEPDEFSTATMRDVMGWIAEAAGSNARFDRDGYLVMDWIRNTAQSFDENDYSEFVPYWYTVPAVNKLYNRATASGEDETTGNGSNGYLIQDNPLIKP